MNTQEKFNKWFTKFKEGDTDYILIATHENKMYYTFNNHPCPVLKLNLGIDTGKGFTNSYSYNAENTEQIPKAFSAIIKGESKIIFNDSENWFSFGVKDCPDTISKMFLYVETATLHSIVFADKNSPKISFTEFLTNGSPDAASTCMSSIFDSMKSTR